MYIKVVCCLCFCFALVQNVKTQRINSWGSSQSNFKNNGNSGFSSWNTNQANNIFSANQNSDFDQWNSKNSNDGSSVSGFGNSPSTWESNSFSTNNNNNNNRNPNSVNGNKETWTSNSGNLNKRPKEDSNSFGFENSQNSNKKKNSANSGWNSNKFTSNESPKEQNERKWESNSVGTINNRPKEEKLSSITNYPSSGTNWDTNSNDFLSSSGNDKNVYSSWGSQNSRPSDVSNTQNSRPGSWGSNTNSNSNNKPKEEKSSSNTNYPSSGTNWNTDSNNFVSSSENDKNVYSSWGSQNSRPSDVSNTQNSSPGSWGSNTVSNNNNNNRPSGSNSNSVLEDEENSVYSSFDSDNNKKPSKNSGSGNWESNTQNNKKTEWSSGGNKKPNDKKSSSNNSKPSGSGSWSSSSGSSNSRPVESEFSNFGNEKPTKDEDRPKDQQNERKTSAPDTSILDELDKNDWYFGSEDNYPEPPFKTNLNIDVSALWNIDKNKKSNQNSDRNSNNNKRRRNRETGRLGMETRETVCECVNVNLCNEEDMIITKEDAKNVGSLIEFICKEPTHVCCRNPIDLETVRGSDIFEDEEENQVDTLQCGQRRLQNSFYASLEDDMALPGELPWILRLRSFKDNVECDGSLIHPSLALTAAHCVEGVNPVDLNITAGVWNSNNEPSQSRNVLDIIPHPDYNSKNPRNDIALLVLDESFQLTDNVNTICLPVTNDKWDLNGCFVADWRSNQINGRISEILGKGNVEFLPQYECQNILLVTEFWRKYILHDSFVCAVEKNGEDECLGEEGGALICPSKKSPDTYLQIGIVSKSLNCDDIGGPGIITNVLHFLDWINKNTFELGLYDDIDVRSL